MQSCVISIDSDVLGDKFGFRIIITDGLEMFAVQGSLILFTTAFPDTSVI